jgi:hypothetical protein
MVDLAKPAFKLGVAALKVGTAAHELQVSVQPDKPQYTVRGKALVRVKVTQGGQPVPGAELAFAAVDEGLLALRDNEQLAAAAGPDDPPARLGRADGHRAERDHRPPPLRPQGRGRGRRRWQGQHARAVRHPAAVAAATWCWTPRARR